MGVSGDEMLDIHEQLLHLHRDDANSGVRRQQSSLRKINQLLLEVGPFKNISSN